MKKLIFLFSFLSLPFRTISFAASLQSVDRKNVTQALQNKTVTTIMVTTLNNHFLRLF